MATTFHAGAVLYARNVARVQAFYHAVLGLDVEHTEREHAVLASAAFQLVVVGAKNDTATAPAVERSPARREGVPVKLVFSVPSIAAARALAPAHGGELLPPGREWDFQGHRVCDGQDPEGNVQISNVVPQLRTTNLAESIRFYTTRIGFTLEFQYDDFYAGVRAGSHVVHLKLVDERDPSIEFVDKGEPFHLYLETDDISATAESLRRNGVHLEQDVHETAWGTRELVIKDDRGHTIYFGSRV